MTGVFAAFAVIGFAAAYVGPTGAALAEVNTVPAPVTLYASTALDAQSLAARTTTVEVAALDRGGYTVYVKPKPIPTPAPAPAPALPSKAKAKAKAQPAVPSPLARIAYTGGGSPAEWMAAAGIAESDWGYVDYIVSKESGWNPNATNRSSGACGLVQALPCGKVPGNGYDPVDNLRWGSGYAQGRYGGWAGAYAFWTSHHWW